jgi:hypothetical protein
MVSEIPVDGFAAMNTDDDVSNKQSIRCTSSRRTSSGRGESVVHCRTQAAYAAQLERDMVADRKKDQESACARIAKVSATKARLQR